MLRLDYSESLGRRIRKDPWPELTIYTTDRIKGSLAAGRPDEARALADYLADETELMREALAHNQAKLCALIARHFGDEVFFDRLYRLTEMAGMFGEIIPPFPTVQEFVWFWAEYKRSQRADLTVTEEPDRFVFRYGSRPLAGGALAVGRPAMAAPSRAYDWTWGRPNVPYYIARLCIWGEIYPAHRFGWPLLITDWAGDEAIPSLQYVYKDPARIPTHYFDRIGVRRDPARFQPLSRWGTNRFKRGGLAALPLADTARPLPALDRPAIIRRLPTLGRGIRQDPAGQLGTYTNDLIKVAIDQGDRHAASVLADYWEYEMRTIRLGYIIIQASLHTLIAQQAGEVQYQEIHEQWQAGLQTAQAVQAPTTQPRTQTIEELVQFRVETKRGQGYRFRVVDEGTRYTLYFEPCGTGGVLRTLRTEDGTPAPYMDETKAAYPWSFGRAGVPYYCLHCWQSGMRSAEKNGWPLYIFDFSDVGDVNGFNTQYIYKIPEAVPADVFRRMGKARDPGKFKRIFGT